MNATLTQKEEQVVVWVAKKLVQEGIDLQQPTGSKATY